MKKPLMIPGNIKCCGNCRNGLWGFNAFKVECYVEKYSGSEHAQPIKGIFEMCSNCYEPRGV